ncbi:MAG: C-GCAxxG-C-C family protein [Oscillospiraceae bacterium]
MDYGKKAVDLHTAGQNCAQSVVCALEDYTDMPENQAAAASAGFGGGFRAGEVCGAISGAVMAMGLRVAKDGKGGKDVPIAAMSKGLAAEFAETFGCVRCAELIAASGHGRCDEYISYCAKRAAELMDEKTED